MSFVVRFMERQKRNGIKKEFKDPTVMLKHSALVASANTKRMVVYQIERALAKSDINRAQLAVLLDTSRAAVNRLLDPKNTSINLQTLERVTQALGKKLHIFFYD